MAWNTQPQSADGVVFLLAPATVFVAQVNGTVALPTANLPYDNVSVGSTGDVRWGMTVWLGTAPGLRDLGWTYVRSTIEGGLVPIGYSSRGRARGQVAPVDNCYITILNTYEVWKKNGRVLDSGTLLKEYDFSASLYQYPVPHVGDLGGLGRVAYVNPDTGLLELSFNSASSYVSHPGDAIILRQWGVDGGTITVGTDSDAAITATFPPGAHWVTLLLLAARPIFRQYLVVALDADTFPPVGQVDGFTLTREASGQIFTCTLKERLDLSAYPPGTVCLYLQREVRGGSVEWVQRFAGYLDTERGSSRASAQGMERGTSLRALDVAKRAAQLGVLPSTIRNETIPPDWSALKDANPDRYLWRLLSADSNVGSLGDFTWSGSSSFPFVALSSSGGDVYSAGDGMAKAQAHRFTCDWRGRLWVKPDPMLRDPDARTSTVQRHLSESDWRSIESTNAPEGVGVIRATAAVASTAVASTLTTDYPEVDLIAPGEAEGQGAGERQYNGWVVEDAEEGKKRIGHALARDNAATGKYTITLAAGVDAEIDPAAQTWVTVDAGADNVHYRGEALSAARGLPEKVVLTLNAETGVGTQVVTWERETVGEPGKVVPRKPRSSYVPPARPPRTPARPTTPEWLLPFDADRMALICVNGLFRTGDFQTRAVEGGPTYVFDGKPWGGTLLDWCPHGGTSPASGWVLTTTELGYLELASGSYTVLQTFATASSFRSLDASFSESGFVLVNSYYPGAGGTKALWATDNASFTETGVHSYDGAASAFSAAYVSSKVPGKAVISVMTGSNTSAAYRTSTYGAAWSALSPAFANSAAGYALIHSPWEGNASDDLYYYPTTSPANNEALYRNGVDISPVIGGNKYTPIAQRRGMDSSPQNRQRMLMVGERDTGSFADARLFVTDTGGVGGDWTDILTSTALRRCACAGNDARVGWAWGVGVLVQVTEQTGGWASDSRLGNLMSLTPGEIVGLAGY